MRTWIGWSCVLALLAFSLGCSTAGNDAEAEADFQKPAPSSSNDYPGDTIVADWEGSTGQWQAADALSQLELSIESVSLGSNSIRYTYLGPVTPDTYPGVAIQEQTPTWDWTGHDTDYIKVDVYNEPVNDDNSLIIRIKGGGHVVPPGAVFQQTVSLTPGWQCIQIPVSSLAFDATQIANVMYFKFWHEAPTTAGDVIYFDALRLGPQDPGWQPPNAVDGETR